MTNKVTFERAWRAGVLLVIGILAVTALLMAINAGRKPSIDVHVPIVRVTVTP